jgi:hypothetical protein
MTLVENSDPSPLKKASSGRYRSDTMVHFVYQGSRSILEYFPDSGVLYPSAHKCIFETLEFQKEHK